jgi:hypothetical protein
LLELSSIAAGLLCEVLSGNSPVCLELDLVLHDDAGAQDNTTPPAAAPAPAVHGSRHSDNKNQPTEQQQQDQPSEQQQQQRQQQAVRTYVRTPSGRVLRRTGNDTDTPLSPSGKEVWGQVDHQVGGHDTDEALTVLELPE